MLINDDRKAGYCLGFVAGGTVMKYGQIIKPEDVVSLIKAGDLRVGTAIEVKPIHSDKWSIAKFVGFSSCSDVIEAQLDSGFCSRYTQVRFPLPALKDGDPVIVSISNLPAIFAGWLNNEIQIYACGTNKWTSSGRRLDSVGVWRLPTKKELHDAGLDGWYDGRIELNEE